MTAALSKYICNIPSGGCTVEVSHIENDSMIYETVPLPKFLRGNIDVDYSDLLERIFNKTSDNIERIDFLSDIWDFNPFVKKSSSMQKVDFSNCNSKEIALYLKYFALFQLSLRNKPSSICQNIKALIRLFSDCFFIKYIDVRELIESIYESNYSDLYIKNTLSNLMNFIVFMESNYDISYGINLREMRNDIKSRKAYVNSYPLIPWDYYNEMMNTAIAVKNDETREKTERIIACALIIQMQSGLRTLDLLSLTVDDLITTTDGNEKIYSLRYYENKTSKLDNETYIEIDVSVPCGEAFETALLLRPESPLNFLFLTKIDKPWNHEYYYRQYHVFMFNNLYELIMKPWRDIQKTRLRIDKYGKYTVYTDEKLEAYVPTPHSFRVNVCTMLTESNMYTRQYCRKHLGHLSSQLDNYYCRPKDRTPEVNKRIAETIQKMLALKATPLGGRNDGEKMSESIRKFLAENGTSNIEKKIMKLTEDEIVDLFKGRLTFNPVAGGCCIKVGTDSKCNLYGNDNTINCAYGQCENVYHFYFNLPETLATFRMKTSAYTLAMESNLTQHALKLNKDSRRLALKVMHEIEQLIDVKNRIKDFMALHPELVPYIEVLDEIKAEVKAWL